MSVKSPREYGLHLLPAFILQRVGEREPGCLYSPHSLSYLVLHMPHPLTSALALGVRPALRCTGGGFSPVSRGKARGSFPVSSCRGHSLVAGGRPNPSSLSSPKCCATRRPLKEIAWTLDKKHFGFLGCAPFSCQMCRGYNNLCPYLKSGRCQSVAHRPASRWRSLQLGKTTSMYEAVGKTHRFLQTDLLEFSHSGAEQSLQSLLPLV